MKWARVDEDGVIVEFTFDDPEGRFHPSLLWVEVDDAVAMHSRFTKTGIEPPIPPQEIVGTPVDVVDAPPAEMPPPDPDAKTEDWVPPTEEEVESSFTVTATSPGK